MFGNQTNKTFHKLNVGNTNTAIKTNLCYNIKETMIINLKTIKVYKHPNK